MIFLVLYSWSILAINVSLLSATAKKAYSDLVLERATILSLIT